MDTIIALMKSINYLAILIILIGWLFGCNETKNRDSVVTFEGDEVLVKNFPRPTRGVSSLYGEDFGSFSFEQLDKYVYKLAKKSSLSRIYIAIQFSDRDNYGSVSLGDKITGIVKLK
jgi:hypothetical protein